MPGDVYQAPTVSEIESILVKEFPSLQVTRTEARRVYATADRDSIFELCTFIHDNLNFEHCSSLSGVDRESTFQVVYHLSNYENGVMIEITSDVPSDDPRIASVASIWGGANWHERETYDMFGFIFVGHPKPERILLPEDVTFFPLRKDFKVGGI